MIEEIENESMAPKEEIDMIVRAFENHDLNKDGYLTKEELKTFIQKMGKIQSISPLIRAIYRVSQKKGGLMFRALFRP